MKRRSISTRLAALSVAGLLLLSSCNRIGEPADPADWGFSATVFYNALGGIINQREIRETNYLPNSLVYEPAGTTGMLITPVKESSILAGWYTAYTESTDADGNTIYTFDPQDRWDFHSDRIQEDMTLYARWIQQAQARYIDPATDQVMFRKNLTAASPITPLSGAVANLVSKPGHTMTGYFHDRELSEPFDFSTYTFIPALPTEKELYEQLAEEFPENFLPYVYVSPTPAPTAEGEVEEGAPQEAIDEEADLVYLRSLGYDLQGDETELQAIRTRKNEIIEEYIQAYLANNEETDVYLRYSVGNVATITSPEDLKRGTSYGFFDSEGGATLTLGADIDMAGKSFTTSEVFTGTLDGQGYTVSNLKLTISTARRDRVTEKDGALFGTLDGATIKDITFKDMEIVVNVPTGIHVNAAALAIEAIGATIENVTFDGLTITTGRGDDGRSSYVVSDSILDNQGSVITGLQGRNVTINASADVEVHLDLEAME